MARIATGHSSATAIPTRHGRGGCTGHWRPTGCRSGWWASRIQWASCPSASRPCSATATDLGQTLTRALAESAAQIVICSPAAARSRWVNEEILTFKRLGRSHRIFCLIVDGEPGHPRDECFPEALVREIGADGQLTDVRIEPIAADVRPGKGRKPDARLKLVAGLLGVNLDELMQREAQRRQRRMTLLVTASLLGMAITSALATAAWLARNDAQRQRARAEAEAETARQTTRFMVDLFKVSDPSEALGNTITAREVLDRGARRIQTELAGQPAIQATLMDTMGTVYTTLGLYEPAVRLVREAADQRRRMLGADHPEVANSLAHLGNVLMLKGEHAQAETNLRQSLELQRSANGPQSAEVAEVTMLLASVLARQGRYEDAEPLLREALGIRRALHGERHPAVAGSIEALGLSYFDRGQYPQAIRELRLALAMRRDLHPQDHPNLAKAIANLAWALQGSGAYPEAELLNREALAMKRRLFGAAHPEIAIGLGNLAYTLELRGDDAAAASAYVEALDMSRSLLGNEHPETANILNNLAFVVYRQGRRSAAIDLLRESLEMRRRILGPEHPDVAATGSSLAYWLVDEGAFDDASRLVEEALAVRRKALGPGHPQVAGTLTVKASLRLAQHRYEDARQLAADARSILVAAALPDDSWQVAAAKATEGAALTRLRRYEEAQALLTSSVPALVGSPIPGLEPKGKQWLVDLDLARGRNEDASAR